MRRHAPPMHIDDLTNLFHANVVLGIFLIVFAKRMGVPVPGLPFLMLAGARAANDALFALAILLTATLASVLADGLWFLAGRRHGRSVLALVCRIAIAPDTCIRKSELSFAKRGALTVVLAKFIPGVAGLAPPLAGALGMSSANFTVLNLAGTILWAGAGIGAGLVLHEQVAAFVQMLKDLGNQALPVLAGAIVAYIGWLALRRFLVTLAAVKAPRILPQQLAEQIERGDPLVVVDVRGPRLAKESRIPGAVHAESDQALLEDLATLPDNVRLVAYCDCPNDVSAARFVAKLRKQGWSAHVLAGGYLAWQAAGLPLQAGNAETAPASEAPAAPRSAPAIPV